MLSSQTTLETKIPYFYSNSHILGCVVAILGLILHYWLELNELPWYVVAILAYLIGSFSFKHKIQAVSISSPVLQTPTKKNNLCATLNQLISNNKAFLPDDALELLASISSTISEILPKLESNPDMLPEVYTVKKIIEEYLPETLACYIKIPTKSAANELVADNKARLLLIEQLSLLNRYLTEIFKNLRDEDMKALIINGRFLKEKFTSDDGFNIQ
jgi:hypothetical protein